MSDLVERHLELDVQLFIARMNRDEGEHPDEDGILDEMEAVYLKATSDEQDQMNRPVNEVTHGQAVRLGVQMNVEVSTMERIVASQNDLRGWIKKGDLAYRSHPCRVFMPLPFALKGAALFKCLDCEPDSTFWIPEPVKETA